MNDAESQRYCPNCKKIMETRVLPEGHSQTQFRGIRRKKTAGNLLDRPSWF